MQDASPRFIDLNGPAFHYLEWGRPGAPVLSIARSSGGEGSTVELRQEEPFFDMEVPVTYKIDGEIASRLISMNGAAVKLELPPGTRWVAVDPDFEIFRKLHRGEIPPALSQVLGSDSTVVVIGSRQHSLGLSTQTIA